VTRDAWPQKILSLEDQDSGNLVEDSRSPSPVVKLQVGWGSADWAHVWVVAEFLVLAAFTNN